MKKTTLTGIIAATFAAGAMAVGFLTPTPKVEEQIDTPTKPLTYQTVEERVKSTPDYGARIVKSTGIIGGLDIYMAYGSKKQWLNDNDPANIVIDYFHNDPDKYSIEDNFGRNVNLILDIMLPALSKIDVTVRASEASRLPEETSLQIAVKATVYSGLNRTPDIAKDEIFLKDYKSINEKFKDIFGYFREDMSFN